jgi:hypothetical protein
MSDPLTRILECPQPTLLPDLTSLIADTNDRDRLIRIRAALLQRAKLSSTPPRVWVSLLNRRIADLYRDGHDSDLMTIHQLAGFLERKSRHKNTGK